MTSPVVAGSGHWPVRVLLLMVKGFKSAFNPQRLIIPRREKKQRELSLVVDE